MTSSSCDQRSTKLSTGIISHIFSNSIFRIRILKVQNIKICMTMSLATIPHIHSADWILDVLILTILASNLVLSGHVIHICQIRFGPLDRTDLYLNRSCLDDSCLSCIHDSYFLIRSFTSMDQAYLDGTVDWKTYSYNKCDISYLYTILIILYTGDITHFLTL